VPTWAVGGGVKHLTLKLNCEGLTSAEVAAKLRELADDVERGEVESSTAIVQEGRKIGVVTRPKAAPKLERAKPAKKPDRAPLGSAIFYAGKLEESLRDAHQGTPGAAGIVLFDLIEPAARITQRLRLLNDVENPPAGAPSSPHI
jgi:hypothetical protein